MFLEILKDGFQVTKHHAHGGLRATGERLLYLDEATNMLICARRRLPDASKADKGIHMLSIVKIEVPRTNPQAFIIWHDNGQKRLTCEMSNKEITLRVAGLLSSLVRIAAAQANASYRT